MAFLIAGFFRNMLVTAVFLSVFIIVGDQGIFERSVVLLLFLIYLGLDRSPDLFRLKIATVLVLTWIRAGEREGMDELRVNIDHLLGALGAPSMIGYLRENAVMDVQNDEKGADFAAAIQTLIGICMFAWLAICYFAQPT